MQRKICPWRARVALEDRSQSTTRRAGFAHPRVENTSDSTASVSSHDVLVQTPRLVRLARSILGSEDLAWDVVQEALVALWQRESPPLDMCGWLACTVVNMSLVQRRKLLRRRLHEERAVTLRTECRETDDPALLLEESELSERLGHALASLPEEYRAAFVLREVENLDYTAIAARLAVPIGTVRSRLARARETLRGRLAHLLSEGSLCLPCARHARARVPGGVASAADLPSEPPTRVPTVELAMARALKRSCAGFLLVVLAGHVAAQDAQPTRVAGAAASPSAVKTAQPEIEMRTLIRSMHTRLQFDKDIRRVAVGDTDVVASEPINNREVLVLGKEVGRTSLIVWFQDGDLKEYTFIVQRDISLLAAALKDIDAHIEVEIAPDRDAIVLRGTVPDLATSRLAEAAAQNYLDARGRRQIVNNQGMLAAESGAAQGVVTPPAATQTEAERLRAPGTVVPTGKVINLLRLEHLPLRPEEHLQQALRAVGGEDVHVRRVLHGLVLDDAKDILVLDGSVQDQVALVRVLSLAASIFVGESADQMEIRVLADESGALSGSRVSQTNQQGFQQNTNSGVGSVSFGLRNNVLTNRIQANVGRATALEIGNGRILSFIQVRDLPQVRIDIRLCELNRSRLESFNSQLAVLNSDFNQPSLNPAGAATAVQGTAAARVGSASNTDLQNALSFLQGSFANQFQVSGEHFALDSLLSVLETRGISHTLSQPSLSVLSGEQAIFQVGGEVPIQTTQTFGTSTVVEVSTTFQEFGIQLSVRPLVGEDGDITLDVIPQVVEPDPELTKTIGQSTGTPQTTVAFDSRSMRTTASLKDGQVMVIGGLISRKTNDQVNGTPFFSKIPLLGDLFKGFSNADDQQELVIIVNPVIVRKELKRLGMWVFPDTSGLLWAPLAEKTSPPVDSSDKPKSSPPPASGDAPKTAEVHAQ
jgi:RNA polymerase sigma factor (sigma-70 family)